MRGGNRSATAQAWIELLGEDPEALTALGVARLRLPAATALRELRRFRLFELCGTLPRRAALEGILHRSIRFYNPHKERCTVRTAAAHPAPARSEERLILVAERGDARRPAAERWWLHETGVAVEIREGVVWALAFEPGADPDARAAELATLRGRRHGLLCNPHAQEARIAGPTPPIPWFGERAPAPRAETR